MAIDTESTSVEGTTGWSEYDRYIIAEMADHIASPSLVRRGLELAGKPVEKILEYAATSSIRPLRMASDIVHRGVARALESSLSAAARIAPPDAVQREASAMGFRVESVEKLAERPLEELDLLADRFDRGNAALLGLEGAIFGAATSLSQGVPFAQVLIPGLIVADVAASMTLLSRHAAQIASCYGYPPATPANRIHIIAAMAPQHRAHDEGYLAAKMAAVETIVEAGAYAVRPSSTAPMLAAGKEAPKLVKLLNYVSKRLGVVLTEKELGMLVPVAGAVLNGGLNIAFQKTGHQTAKDYFRLISLSRRYGDDSVRSVLSSAIALRKSREIDGD